MDAHLRRAVGDERAPRRAKIVGDQAGEARANILTLADAVRHLLPRRLAPAIRPDIPVRADGIETVSRP
jgi:hypothetical protein